MDVMLDGTFWSDVSLTAASRLALVAALLWVLKMALDMQNRTAGELHRIGVASGGRKMRLSVGKRIHEKPPQESVALASTETTDAPSAERPERDRMRKELLAYLGQRSAGRMN